MKKLFIIFAVLCLAAPAMAADWNFYGSARMQTFWTNNDVGYEGAQADDTDVRWAPFGNARIGANVKFNDQIAGKFEVGDTFNKRQLFATYTFGNGMELLLGQTYTPTSQYFYSFSGYGDDNNLLGIGQFYTGRKPMIQFKMGSFKLALVTPSTGPTVVKGDNDDAIYGWYFPTADDPTTPGDESDPGLYIRQGKAKDIAQFEKDLVTAGTITKEEAASRFILNGPTGAFEVKDTDVIIPKIEASYKFKTDMFFVDVFGGYQTYDLDAPSKEYSIDSYVAGLGGGVNVGALFFNAGVHMGQNLANYGNVGFLGPDNLAAASSTAVTALKIGAASYNSTKDEIVDNDGLGYLAVLGFNASEMFTIEAGYGYQQYEDDADGAKTDSAKQYYVNCTINIAPGFFIVPEIGKVEWELDDADFGDYLYYGAKWQINF
jgi:hypothetical protein